jgi:hypothetical protein
VPVELIAQHQDQMPRFASRSLRHRLSLEMEGGQN